MKRLGLRSEQGSDRRHLSHPLGLGQRQQAPVAVSGALLYSGSLFQPTLGPPPFQALFLFSSSTAPGPQLTGMQVPPASHARQSSLKIQAGHQPVGTSTGSPGVTVSVKPRYTWEDGISHYLNQNGLWACGGGGIFLIDNRCRMTPYLWADGPELYQKSS